MQITEKTITGPIARQLREELGVTQAKFWNPVGVQQSVACRYEQNHAKLPRSIRILLVATHVSGLKIDTSTPEGVAELSRLAGMQASFKNATAHAASARTDLASAAKSITAAEKILAKV